MKVSLLKIRSFIFIFLFLLGTALTIPLHRKIVSRAEEMVKGLSSNLYEKTGLYFNYENLSPSILSKTELLRFLPESPTYMPVK